jgi:hypothetical protein
MKRVSIRRRSRQMDGEAWCYRHGCTLDRMALRLQQRRSESARNAASSIAPSGPKGDRQSTSSAIPVAPDIRSNR